MSHQFALQASAVDKPESDLLRVHFDRHSSVPLYRQLKYHIAHAISTGRLIQGAPLPSVRAAGQALDLAAATVQKAYAELQRDGLITSEQGRGAFVAKLESPAVLGVEEKVSALRDLVLPGILQAQTLGFTREEIADTMNALLGPDQGGPIPKVVFVGRTLGLAQKYVGLLKEGLVGVGCEIMGVDFASIERSNGLDEHMPVHMLVSMVSQFPRVREIGNAYGVRTYGLTVELTDETKRRIMAIPVDARIGLITNSEFLSNTRSIVDALIWVPDLVAVASEDPHRVDKLMRDRDWILHTASTVDVATQAAPSGARMIVLESTPMSASVVHLAQLLHSIRQESRFGAPHESEAWVP